MHFVARRVQQDTQPILLMALPVLAFGIAQAIATMAREEAARFDAPHHASGRIG